MSPPTILAGASRKTTPPRRLRPRSISRIRYTRPTPPDSRARMLPALRPAIRRDCAPLRSPVAKGSASFLASLPSEAGRWRDTNRDPRSFQRLRDDGFLHLIGDRITRLRLDRLAVRPADLGRHLVAVALRIPLGQQLEARLHP